MPPISVKINRPPADNNEPAKPAKNILNLMNGSPAKTKKGGSKKYLWLLLLLAVVQGLVIAWLYLAKPVSPYFKLLPPNLIASSYFNQSSLLELLKSNQTSWPPINWSANTLRETIKKAKIEQPEQLLKLFHDQMALAILPPETGTVPIWLILASIKDPAGAFSQARDQFEQALKQNYNLINESYRQIKIFQIQPLSQNKNNLFYAETNGYFILTNDNALIKATIDKLVGR